MLYLNKFWLDRTHQCFGSFLEFIMLFHKYTKTPVETAAAAVNAGCNLELGLPNLSNNIYSHLAEAVKKVATGMR